MARLGKEDDAVYKAKSRIVASLAVHGMTNSQIGAVTEQTVRTVQRYKRFAEKHGYIEAVRKDLTERLLPKAADFYEEVMDTPIDKLQDSPKGYQIKLNAAKDLASGLGAFRKESATTSKSLKGTVDLDEYLKIRALKNNLSGGASLTLADGDVIEVEATDVTDEDEEAEVIDDECVRGQFPGTVGVAPEDQRDREGELLSDLVVPAREGMGGGVGGSSDPSRALGDRGPEREAGTPAGTSVDDRGAAVPSGPIGEGEVIPTVIA